jgi:hypothetical protein
VYYIIVILKLTYPESHVCLIELNKEYQYPASRRVVWLQNWPGYFVEGKKLHSPVGSQTQNHPVQSLIALPMKVSLLYTFCDNEK